MRIPQTALLCWALVVLVLAPSGCGKKGPPRVPRTHPLPVVTELGVARDNQTLILGWSLPAEKEGQGAEVAGFAVYRAKTAVNADCPDCPHPYEMIGKVDRQSRRVGSSAWQYRDRVTPGYVYRYRVRCYDPAGTLGRPSDTVKHIMAINRDARDPKE